MLKNTYIFFLFCSRFTLIESWSEEILLCYYRLYWIWQKERFFLQTDCLLLGIGLGTLLEGGAVRLTCMQFSSLQTCWPKQSFFSANFLLLELNCATSYYISNLLFFENFFLKRQVTSKNVFGFDKKRFFSTNCSLLWIAWVRLTYKLFSLPKIYHWRQKTIFLRFKLVSRRLIKCFENLLLIKGKIVN